MSAVAERDYLTREGANLLAERISEWWARRGCAVQPSVVRYRGGAEENCSGGFTVTLPPVAGRPDAKARGPVPRDRYAIYRTDWIDGDNRRLQARQVRTSSGYTEAAATIDGPKLLHADGVVE